MFPDAWQTKNGASTNRENRAEQNEIRAKIHYGSRKQKWILSRKTNGTKQDTKTDFPLKTKHDYNSKTLRSPPSLPHFIIETQVWILAHSL
jgi:hypothetical protein